MALASGKISVLLKQSLHCWDKYLQRRPKVALFVSIAMVPCRCIANIGIGSTLALLCLVGNGKAEAAQQVIEGPARVIDGDTLEVSQPSQLSMYKNVSESGFPVRERGCHIYRFQESSSACLVWMLQRRRNHAVTKTANHMPVVSPRH